MLEGSGKPRLDILTFASVVLPEPLKAAQAELPNIPLGLQVFQGRDFLSST
jgi:hypothetical protein